MFPCRHSSIFLHDDKLNRQTSRLQSARGAPRPALGVRRLDITLDGVRINLHEIRSNEAETRRQEVGVFARRGYVDRNDVVAWPLAGANGVDPSLHPAHIAGERVL